jgi:DNA-binding MarR family transcriptional regulator
MPSNLTWYVVMPQGKGVEVSRNLKLLLETRETIPVLCYISQHPKSSPTKAIAEMRIGLKTWYAAVRSLEDLGLVAGVRPLGGKKVRYFALTREGNEAMTALTSISLILAGSKGSMKADLQTTDKERESDRAGLLLCQLLLHAEREADREEILALIATAKACRRPIEAKLGAALLSFISGDPRVALSRIEEGLGGAASLQPPIAYFKFRSRLAF